MTVAAHKETLEFQTEVRQLLHLMIHSLYSNREIFLRELISNAADAADKLRFEALSDDALYDGDGELRVRIELDASARTLSVSDNGIGMNRAEVIEHIGTIARSGTRRFMENLSGDAARDSKLIGQFGVGFYSAFIVADKVTLSTRRAGLGPEHGVRWESAGTGDYSIETLEKAARGTEIVLHLKADADDFLNAYRLREIVRRYSDHIALPIQMLAEGESPIWETVNRASALWARAKRDISEDDYRAFYQHLAHDAGEPLAHAHHQVEGTQSYTLLLYVPKRAPFDLWDRTQREGIKLYVRRVFIMDAAEALMPAYLRFMRGVVDSDDLPLNVSREILQHDRQIETLRAAAVKRSLDLLEDLAGKKPEDYAGFWQQFGRVLKEGPGEDHANRERIAKLLRFASTQDDAAGECVSLGDYVARAKFGQDKIYYLSAESVQAAAKSPQLEVFRDQGIEVLLLGDRVDEWLVSNLTEFEGKPLISAARGDLDLGKLADEKRAEALEQAGKDNEPVIARMRAALGERVKSVRVSARLTRSPACLALDAHDMPEHLRRMLEAAGHDAPKTRPHLEINPAHPLIARLRSETDDARFNDWSQLLYEQAVLAEGGQLDDAAGFVARLNGLLLALSG